MKYSQFNTIIPYDDKFVLHNSFTNLLIGLDPLLKDLLAAAIHEGVDQMEDIHPSFYEVLKKSEFIVDDHVDEVEKVRTLREFVDFNESSYHLTINPTMNCNFKCWYCYETHIKASRMNEDIIDKVNRFLGTQLMSGTKLKRFELSWFGGEPLLYFYDIVLPIIIRFNELTEQQKVDAMISFTTNGYLINPEMVQLFKKYKVGSFQITIDGYGEEHDKVRYVSATRGSYSKIMENIALLVKNGIFVRMRINYTGINMLNIHKLIDDIQWLTEEDRQYLNIDFHRVWQDDEALSDDFLSEQIDKFRIAGFHVSSGLAMDNVRHSCYADKTNSAVINYNGEVFKCTARDFTTVRREGYIGDSGAIIWENGNLEKRKDIKFKNKPCLSCRLLPICNGGCSQHALEYYEKGEEYCVNDFDENKKNDIIREKVKEILALA